MQCIDKVADGIYLGNAVTARNENLLVDQGITHIISVGKGLVKHFPEKFSYKHIDIEDLPSVQIINYFQECNEFIDSALENHGRVYIHCYQGISRSTTIAVAYLIYKKNLTAFRALKFIKRAHLEAAPNKGFLVQLENYEKLVFSKNLQLTQIKKSVGCNCNIF